MSDVGGPDGVERRREAVTRADLEALVEQVGDLDNTVRTLFLDKASAEQIFPNWHDLEMRLREVEHAAAQKRRRSAIRTAAGVVLGVVVAILFAYGITQYQDRHMERCGPAHRPVTLAQQKVCDRWAITHDHPLQSEADAELAERLLRSLGVDPDIVAQLTRRTTTTTVRP